MLDSLTGSFLTMTSQSGQLSQQQHDDLLLDMVQKLGTMSIQLNSLSKRVDVVWDQVIDKPESSKKNENGEQIENESEQGIDFNEETPEGHTLRRPETTPHRGY
jgi:hypothetical protein